MAVTINGKKPDSIDARVLENIVAKDRFLQKYSLDQIRSGQVPLNEARGISPVPAQYTGQGDVVVTAEESKVARLKQ